MTQDETIEMAIQLGFDERLSNNWLVSEEQLMRFAKLVAAKEREACNAICKEAYEWAESRSEREGSDPHFAGRMRAAQDIGQAIRARGEAQGSDK